uniref:Thioredoxin domain-containing protein n=1 Tax=Romanomermis culicivorax TaxID=13658 RepID=A0A915HYS8_ROMCU
MISSRWTSLFVSLWFCCIVTIRAKEEAKIPPKPSEPEDAPPKNPLSRGWNDDIAWVSLEDGYRLAKEQRKPLFVLIHKTWCHACQNLKKTFAKAKAIQDMAKNFIMVNCEDDEEPWEEDFSPDGAKYIPRLFFVDPDGTVLKDVKNPKEEFQQYPYYYSNPAPIITAMKQIMKKYHMDDQPMSKTTGKQQATETKTADSSKSDKTEGDKTDTKKKSKKEL